MYRRATATCFGYHHQDALAYSIPWEARNKHDLDPSNDNVGKFLTRADCITVLGEVYAEFAEDHGVTRTVRINSDIIS